MGRRSDEELSIWEHVAEARTYFFVAIAALIIGAVITHSFRERIMELLTAPLGGLPLSFLSPLDPLLFILRIDFFGGFLLALPIILFCVLRFISPALGNRGTAVTVSFIGLSAVLSVVACLYTYMVVLPLGMQFLLSLTVPGVENSFTAEHYLDFVLLQFSLMLLVFHIPCVVTLLAWLRVLDPRLIARNRGIVYIAMIILLSVLTPTTDLFTLALVLVPTLILLEISLLIGRAVYLREHGQETHA